MGLFIWVESDRTSTFRLAQAMRPLAGFGIIHGLHEWIEMFQNVPMTTVVIPNWVFSESLRLTHLVISFVLLIIFGARLIYATHYQARYDTLFAIAATGSLLLVWVLSILITQRVYQVEQAELQTAVDVLARYTLGIPGALLAAWAITLEQRSFHKHGLSKSGDDLMRAALALVIYGFPGQIFVKPSFLFPSNVINATLFMNLFGIPVELFRAVAATIMAVFMVRGMRAFEFERQQKLLEANQAKLAAQELALSVQKNAQEETDRLNRDLRAALMDLTLLFDFSSSMGKTLERDTVVDTAVSHVAHALSWINGAAILWHHPETSLLEIISHDGLLAHPTGYDDDAIVRMGTAVAQQKNALRLFANELTPVENFPQPTGYYVMGFPLFRQEEVSGVLVVQVNATAVAITPKDIKLLQTLVGQLSIALENAFLYQKVWERDILRGELLHQVVSAQEKERQRIARELHDGTGQLLTALGLGFAATVNNMQTNPTLAHTQLIKLKEMVNQALKDLRDLISDLRPSVLDDLGLMPALQGLVKNFEERMRDSGQRLHVSMEIGGTICRLHPDIETIAFRIMQEALTNITKHAQAAHVYIRLTFNEPCLNLVITDDGSGFEAEKYLHQKATTPAWGLIGMQERVGLVGGNFQIQSQVGSGTTINVCLPLLDKGA
ncbi:MAG: GAF domain-containing sensor histidine kinase [Ardenticatenaceae bacterium]|nr:GAF domain-containing sensor histidine kinase [Ardenticatenaceae bacterium]